MLITGITRALVGYEPGCQGDRDEWNAVRIADKWRLIHPVLAAVSTSGHVPGGWIQKEDDGAIVTKKERRTHGKNRIEFRDYWFCVKPHEFAYFCYPDNPMYQFVPADSKRRSLKKFLSMPCVYPPYFQLEMDVIGNKSCMLKSDGQRVQISFRVPTGGASKMNLSYKLYVKDTTEMEAGLKDITERLVLNARDVAKDIFSFEIRFPIEGTYKLEIFANRHSNKLRCCMFKVKCKQRTKDFRKLPIDPGPSGWGFIPKAEKFGLRKPSNTAPKLQIKPQVQKEPPKVNAVSEDEPETETSSSTKPEIAQNVDLSFDIDPKALDETEYNSILYSSDFIDDEHDDLQKHVSNTKDVPNHKLHVNATVPCDGEFALVVEAAETGSGSDFETVCSYLLTTLDTGSDEDADDVGINDDDSDGDLTADDVDGQIDTDLINAEYDVNVTYGTDVNVRDKDSNEDVEHLDDVNDVDVLDVGLENGDKEDGADGEWLMNEQCIFFLIATAGVVAFYGFFEVVVRVLLYMFT